jgi:predicted N-acetyltransferase YhbS
MTAPLTIRLMTSDDIPAGQRLREQAGWNQTADDWQRLLAWEPDGCFVVELDGTVVASATTTVYGPELAFIGMVLVDVEHRRQGVGGALFRHAMAYLDGRGVATIGLDSTPAAEMMYDRFGYREVYRLERWIGPLPDLPPGEARTLRPEDLPAVIAFDADAFGLDRGRIVHALATDHPAGCFVVEGGGAVQGYLLSRPGTRAWHLGPLVARDGDTAERLVRAALQAHRGEQAVMDVMLGNETAVALANRLGLAPVRPFIRMTRGAPPPPASFDLLYTSAAPELG